ncbi:MAG: hypothetical protein EZS28_011930 [Streblomastix strix]|uniref:Uncharacterized protein n=1 Tax=Streblomastix strix TaxID=222440 RepID=A0A5J4WC78_9EUKA|nr:MAG: hypothetical protein EZS28_011930 [Streblomastix strix]
MTTENELFEDLYEYRGREVDSQFQSVDKVDLVRVRGDQQNHTNASCGGGPAPSTMDYISRFLSYVSADAAQLKGYKNKSSFFELQVKIFCIDIDNTWRTFLILLYEQFAQDVENRTTTKKFSRQLTSYVASVSDLAKFRRNLFNIDKLGECLHKRQLHEFHVDRYKHWNEFEQLRRIHKRGLQSIYNSESRFTSDKEFLSFPNLHFIRLKKRSQEASDAAHDRYLIAIFCKFQRPSVLDVNQLQNDTLSMNQHRYYTISAQEINPYLAISHQFNLIIFDHIDEGYLAFYFGGSLSQVRFCYYEILLEIEVLLDFDDNSVDFSD